MGEVDDAIKKVVPFYAKRKPASEYQLTYDSSTETLEPVYFWVLDFMNGMFGGRVEKLMDNFASSPGSGRFSELQGKASQMQQEASRVLGTVNNILKGIINLIYDLKEFKLRLSHYEAANSKDKNISEAGILSLKQIWMDKVDLVARGQGSLNALSSGNLQFVTLRDAFMIAKSPEDVDDMDLNDRVKRILKPRLQEFLEWKKRSEQELKKRYEIEKIYLRSQVNALQLNARWARPYLRAAERLRQNDIISSRADLVTTFNTIFLQLTLMGKSPINVQDEVMDKRLPRDFAKMKNLRKYNAVAIIDFEFRGIPSKTGQHYTFGGRVDVKFKGYSLTDKEIELVKMELKKSDLEAALTLVDGMTKDSLEQIQVDIDEILNDKVEVEKRGKEEDINPFSALFSIFKPEKPKKIDKKESELTEKEKQEIFKQIEKEVKKPENYAEQYLRNFSSAEGANKTFTVYDVYKKGHGMPGFPFPYSEEKEPRAPISKAEEWFLNKK